MKFRKFSNTGWRISEIGLGCWGIGGNWDDVQDDQAKKVLFRSLDKGINFACNQITAWRRELIEKDLLELLR